MSTRVAVLHDYVQPMELDSRAKDSGALQISASSRDTVLIPGTTLQNDALFKRCSGCS
jgi:hypothetical protein